MVSSTGSSRDTTVRSGATDRGAASAANVSLWDDLTLEQKVERLQYVIFVLSAWLVQAQTGFGKQDYDGIQNLIHHGSVSRAS